MTGDELKNRLAAKYPDIGLTFGYIGGVHTWGDDRRWYFFTAVRPPHKDSCLSWGSCSTEKLDEFLAKAERELEAWIIAKVLPEAKHVYRAFEVRVPGEYAESVEAALIRAGASFGIRGHGWFDFSLRYKTLEDIQQIVYGITGTTEPGVKVKESP